MLDVFVVDAARAGTGFSNPVVAWTFGIKFGPRIENQLISRKTFDSPDGAMAAGERQKQRLLAAALTPVSINGGDDAG